MTRSRRSERSFDVHGRLDRSVDYNLHRSIRGSGLSGGRRVVRDYEYDAFGRVTKNRTVIGTGASKRSYETESTYRLHSNGAGWSREVVYPTGSTTRWETTSSRKAGHRLREVRIGSETFQVTHDDYGRVSAMKPQTGHS